MLISSSSTSSRSDGKAPLSSTMIISCRISGGVRASKECTVNAKRPDRSVRGLKRETRIETKDAGLDKLQGSREETTTTSYQRVFDSVSLKGKKSTPCRPAMRMLENRCRIQY